MIGLVVMVGLLDQVPTSAVPDTSALAARLDATRALVHDLEARLPQGSAVFQLPVMPFPGFGSQYTLDTQYPLVPYLVGGNDLRWSFGGVRGTPAATWQENWAQLPSAPMIRGLALAGYDAVVVDGRGELDGGAALRHTLDQLVGPARDRTPDGTQSWYDLRPLQTALATDAAPGQVAHARGLLLNSAFAVIRNNQPPSSPPSPGIPQWFEHASRIELHNPLSTRRRIVLHLVTSAAMPSTLRISGNGSTWTVPLTTRPESHELPLTLLPGTTVLRVSTDAPVMYAAPILRAQRDLTAVVRVDRLVVTDPAVTDLVG